MSLSLPALVIVVVVLIVGMSLALAVVRARSVLDGVDPLLASIGPDGDEPDSASTEGRALAAHDDARSCA